ncbi:hypothetical protein BH23ACT11_BH23ACT11_17550 [soil metagenome]
MASVDVWIESFLQGQGNVTLVLVVSLALGLRHATDPDHLAAVTTLIASEEEREQAKQAGVMGLLWGAGHGTTLVLIGLPLVLLGKYLPETIVQAAEFAIGVIIVLLAARLLLRWRQGLFHAHTHVHNGETHRHVHSHADGSSHEHEHVHASSLRTPLSSYGVGLVHGVGGSGGLMLLLLSTISDKVEATVALLLFAAGTAASMAVLSTAFGLTISGGPIARNFGRVAPV